MGHVVKFELSRAYATETDPEPDCIENIDLLDKMAAAVRGAQQRLRHLEYLERAYADLQRLTIEKLKAARDSATSAEERAQRAETRVQELETCLARAYEALKDF